MTKKQRQEMIETRRKVWTPGNVIYNGFWRNYDKVVGYRESDDGMQWEVTVATCDVSGKVQGVNRVHATPFNPKKDKLVIKVGM